MEQPQGHAGIPIPTPTYSSPVSDHDLDHDDDHPDISPVGSPDLTESDNPPPSDQPPSSALSDDLRLKIIKQVEYYFSDENLPNDKFLLKYVTKNVEGYGECQTLLYSFLYFPAVDRKQKPAVCSVLDSIFCTRFEYFERNRIFFHLKLHYVVNFLRYLPLDGKELCVRNNGIT